MTAPLLFPVGHYLGATFPVGGGDLESHVVRVAWQLRRLQRQDLVMVWALAHGVPDGPGASAWTRASAEGAARAAGVRDVAMILDELTELDLLVELEPGTDDAADFARLYRLRALLTGLGELPGEPNTFGIGLAGQAVARVDGFTYEFWKWAPQCDSLWHACDIFARARGEDVRDVIDRMLPGLQELISSGAAYLDEADEVWPGPLTDLDDVSTAVD